MDGELLYRQNDVDKEGLMALEGSSIGAYGPWLVYQSTVNSLSVVRNLNVCFTSKINTVSKNTIDFDMLPGTKFAIVPLTTNGLDIGLGSIGLFYQGTSGDVDLYYTLTDSLKYKSYNHTRPDPSGPWIKSSKKAPFCI
jgi:hypothetical protein